jgi:hypothetical protein
MPGRQEVACRSYAPARNWDVAVRGDPAALDAVRLLRGATRHRGAPAAGYPVLTPLCPGAAGARLAAAQGEYAPGVGDGEGSGGGRVPDGGRGPLEGRWRRVGAPPAPRDPESVQFGHDPGLLPGEVEFRGARYRATKAPGQTFIAWDVGTYDVEDGRLTITLANDAETSYAMTIAGGGDEFTVTDATGADTTYQRQGERL